MPTRAGLPWLLTLALFVSLAACGDAEPNPEAADAARQEDEAPAASTTPLSEAPADQQEPAPDEQPTEVADGDGANRLAICDSPGFSVPPAQGFAHWYNTWLTSYADPEHSAQDVIAPLGGTASLPGKFAYGALSKDLEREAIELYLHDCSAWRPLDTLITDRDGRTHGALDTAGAGLGVGAYGLRQVVLGDASTVASTLRVLPAGTRAVVLDIDGTLTTDDAELFHDAIDELFLPIHGGDYVPEAYTSARELTELYAEKGYLIVYLTGRPYWLTGITRSWLAELGFAPGHLHLTDSNGEAAPTVDGVGTYKADYLASLQALGLVFDYAYGNASTDIYAYAQAGIPLERTFIIGSLAGEGGTQAIYGGYEGHLGVAATHPAAEQPAPR